jgi:hypothetical protein
VEMDILYKLYRHFDLLQFRPLAWILKYNDLYFPFQIEIIGNGKRSFCPICIAVIMIKTALSLPGSVN